MTSSTPTDSGLRRVVRLVALLNLGYFGVEFAVAVAIGSVSLFADSIDFLEDASINLLIVLALGWTVRNRARIGMLLAGVLLVPGLATLWTAWEKFNTPIPPSSLALSLAGLGAPSIFLVPICWPAIGTTAAASPEQRSFLPETMRSPMSRLFWRDW